MIWAGRVFRQQNNQGLVRLAAFRHGADAGLQMRVSVRILLHAVNRIPPAIRCEANGQADMIIVLFPETAQTVIG